MAKTYLPPPCAEHSVLPELAYSGHKERVRAVAAASAVPLETLLARNSEIKLPKIRKGEKTNPATPSRD